MTPKEILDTIVSFGIMGGFGFVVYIIYGFIKPKKGNGDDRNTPPGGRKEKPGEQDQNGYIQQPAIPGTFDNSKLPNGVTPGNVDGQIIVKADARENWQNEFDSALKDIADNNNPNIRK